MDQDIVVIPSDKDVQQQVENRTQPHHFIDMTELGSFIHIPSHEKKENTSTLPSIPPYELITLCNSPEPILLISDYRLLPTKQSENLHRTNSKLQNTVPSKFSPSLSNAESSSLPDSTSPSPSQPSQPPQPPSPSQPQPQPQPQPQQPPLPPPPCSQLNPQPDSVIYRILKPNYLSLEQISENSPITILNDLDSSAYELLTVQARISTLGELANLRQHFEKVYQFLKETDLINNLDELISNAQLVLQRVHSSAPRSSVSQLHNRTHEIKHSLERPTTTDTTTLRPDSPISALSGFDWFHVSQLQRHAYITTVSELATFAVDYPGMYSLLKVTGLIPSLDEMINEAKNIVLRHRHTKDQSETSLRLLGDNHNNKTSTTTASTTQSSVVESHDSIYHSFSSSSTLLEEKDRTNDKTTQ